MPIFTQTHHYQDNPATVYLAAFNDNSRRTVRSAVDSIVKILTDNTIQADQLAWHLLRAPHLAAFRAYLTKHYAPSTANRYLTTVRGILKTAWRLGLLDRETMERAVDVAPIRGQRQPKGRVVRPTEISTLFRVCSQDPNEVLGARDTAILATLYGGGLRRAEIAGLRVEDIDLANGRCKVIGKGNKERNVYLPEGSLKAIQNWLEHRGRTPGALFNRVLRSGAVIPGAINPQSIYEIIGWRCKDAGLKPFSPHDLRRSFISELLNAGVDICTIARQVGHSSVQVTAQYDRRDETTQQLGVSKLNVPYTK